MFKSAWILAFLVTSTALAEPPPHEGLDQLPELVTFVEADYPPAALKQGLAGTVLLELLVNEFGSVDSVAVLRPLEPSLDAAACAAAGAFIFQPAKEAGEAVPVIIEYEYTFSVREELKYIEEYINFSGTLKEKGTRVPVTEALVVVAFPEGIRDTTLRVPPEAYLERIGEFPGQYLEEGRLVTYTDSLGHFAFTSLPAGALAITFPNAGYVQTSSAEVLKTAERIAVTYWLERSHYDEYEIIVYGKAEKKEVSRQTLQIAEIEKIPGFGGDALKVVQALPGVARPAFVSGEIIVRGSGSEDTRYFLDGIDIPLLFHFGGVKSTYNSQALAAIDLYPGGFNARYGGCVGGVIEIKGRPGRTDRWQRTVDLNLLDSSLLAEGPIGEQFSLSVAARTSYIATMAGLIESALEDVDLAIVPAYRDIVTRLDYRPSARDHMFLTFFGVDDDMEFIFEDFSTGSSEVNAAKDALSFSDSFLRVIYGYDRQIGRRMRNELRLAWGQDDYRGNIFGEARYKFHGNNLTLRDEFAIEAHEKLTCNLGLDFARQPFDYEVVVLGAGDSRIERTFGDYAGYVNLEYRPTARTLLIPGFRYDHFPELNKSEANYRLTTQYQLHPAHRLKGAIGTYSQSPRPMGQAIDPVFGNPDLPPTLAKHFTLGDDWQINDMLSVSMEAYYNTQEKIPMETDSLGLNFLPDMDARMYGFELMLRRARSQRFFGWISYSISRSERRAPRKPNSSITGEWDPEAWYLAGADQTHHLEVLGSWQLPRNWGTGMRLRYVSGNPETPRLGYTSDKYEFNADENYYVPLQGDYRSDRMEPFFQIDVRLDKKWVFKNWMLATYLDIQNLNYFVYNSPEMYIYNYDDSERKAIGGIILPTLGFRAEF